MPELPEVETTRRGIAPWLENKQLADIRVHQSKLRWPVPLQLGKLAKHLVNRVSRRGKYLLLETARGTAIVHLGMSGSLRICSTDEPCRKHDHVEFELEDGHILRFHDPRRFGCILWTDSDPLSHPLLAKLGPEPLSEAFNPGYLRQQAKHRKTSIKQLLMDSHVVVGVGNIYASESLFMAGIRPGRAARSIRLAELGRLTIAIKQVLDTAIQAGGTTLRDFVNSEGNPGYFAQSLRVYGRSGEACQQCGQPIKSRVIGQRSSFYCPSCQS